MKKSITEQSKLKKRIEELELEVMRLKKKLNQVSEIGNTIYVPKSFDSIFGEAQATIK
jgi:hypothetical protein